MGRPIAVRSYETYGALQMTVLLIHASQAAETLAAFHRHRIKQTLGAQQDYDREMVQILEADIERIKGHIAASSATVEDQAQAVRSRDLELAFHLLDRHPITHGYGMAVEETGPARVALARDIADGFQAARGTVSAS